MPQIFLSKFRDLTVRNKKRRNHKKYEIDSDSNDSSNDDVDLYSPNILSMVTRKGPVILKLHETFEKMFKNGIPSQSNNIECITACGNPRNTILYPCRHIHLCRQCWFLLKTYEQSKNTTFENDDEDDITKPRCPYCRNRVDSSDEVYL